MAQQAVSNYAVSIQLACLAFLISETYYRYQHLLSNEIQEIANRLINLTVNESEWGHGLCFYYLRNVKGLK